MKKLIQDLALMEQFSKDLGGVFSLSDLKSLFPEKNADLFYRRLSNLEKANVLKRVLRGIYVFKEYDMEVLSQKICPLSYISFEAVLAKNLIIGTIPKRELKAVKMGRKREYSSPNGKIIHVGVAPHLYFGFESIQGVQYAVKEKAVLDTLYFHIRGMRFYFDIYSDLNIASLNIPLMKQFLKKYRNPRFVVFVRQFFGRNL